MSLKEGRFQMTRRIKEKKSENDKFKQKILLTVTPFLMLFQKIESPFFTKQKPYLERSNKQMDRLAKQELKLPKRVTQRLTHSLIPKDDNAVYGEFFASK